MIDILIFAFCFACTAWFFQWIIGQPLSGTYIQGRIFSLVGRSIARRFSVFEAHHKGKPDALNPWKVFTCPVCFCFWVSVCLAYIFWSPMMPLAIPTACLFSAWLNREKL